MNERFSCGAAVKACVVLLAGGVTEQLKQVNKLLQFTVVVVAGPGATHTQVETDSRSKPDWIQYRR